MEFDNPRGRKCIFCDVITPAGLPQRCPCPKLNLKPGESMNCTKCGSEFNCVEGLYNTIPKSLKCEPCNKYLTRCFKGKPIINLDKPEPPKNNLAKRYAFDLENKKPNQILGYDIVRYTMMLLETGSANCGAEFVIPIFNAYFLSMNDSVPEWLLPYMIDCSTKPATLKEGTQRFLQYYDPKSTIYEALITPKKCTHLQDWQPSKQNIGGKKTNTREGYLVSTLPEYINLIFKCDIKNRKFLTHQNGFYVPDTEGDVFIGKTKIENRLTDTFFNMFFPMEEKVKKDKAKSIQIQKEPPPQQKEEILQPELEIVVKQIPLIVEKNQQQLELVDKILPLPDVREVLKDKILPIPDPKKLFQDIQDIFIDMKKQQDILLPIPNILEQKEFLLPLPLNLGQMFTEYLAKKNNIILPLPNPEKMINQEKLLPIPKVEEILQLKTEPNGIWTKRYKDIQQQQQQRYSKTVILDQGIYLGNVKEFLPLDMIKPDALKDKIFQLPMNLKDEKLQQVGRAPRWITKQWGMEKYQKAYKKVEQLQKRKRWADETSSDEEVDKKDEQEQKEQKKDGELKEEVKEKLQIEKKDEQPQEEVRTNQLVKRLELLKRQGYIQKQEEPKETKKMIRKQGYISLPPKDSKITSETILKLFNEKMLFFWTAKALDLNKLRRLFLDNVKLTYGATPSEIQTRTLNQIRDLHWNIQEKLSLQFLRESLQMKYFSVAPRKLNQKSFQKYTCLCQNLVVLDSYPEHEEQNLYCLSCGEPYKGHLPWQRTPVTDKIIGYDKYEISKYQDDFISISVFKLDEEYSKSVCNGQYSWKQLRTMYYDSMNKKGIFTVKPVSKQFRYQFSPICFSAIQLQAVMLAAKGVHFPGDEGKLFVQCPSLDAVIKNSPSQSVVFVEISFTQRSISIPSYKNLTFRGEDTRGLNVEFEFYPLHCSIMEPVQVIQEMMVIAYKLFQSPGSTKIYSGDATLVAIIMAIHDFLSGRPFLFSIELDPICTLYKKLLSKPGLGGWRYIDFLYISFELKTLPIEDYEVIKKQNKALEEFINHEVHLLLKMQYRTNRNPLIPWYPFQVMDPKIDIQMNPLVSNRLLHIEPQERASEEEALIDFLNSSVSLEEVKNVWEYGSLGSQEFYEKLSDLPSEESTQKVLQEIQSLEYSINSGLGNGGFLSLEQYEEVKSTILQLLETVDLDALDNEGLTMLEQLVEEKEQDIQTLHKEVEELREEQNVKNLESLKENNWIRLAGHQERNRTQEWRCLLCENVYKQTHDNYAICCTEGHIFCSSCILVDSNFVLSTLSPSGCLFCETGDQTLTLNVVTSAKLVEEGQYRLPFINSRYFVPGRDEWVSLSYQHDEQQQQ